MTNPPGAMPPLPEPLPCPFCGGKAQRFKAGLDERFSYADEVKYSCNSCSYGLAARGDTSKPGYANNSTVEARALERWNRRTPVAAPLIERVAELEAERDRMRSGLDWVRGYIGRYDPPGLPNHIVQHIDAALTPTKD